MKYLSICDGIGAAHVAWKPLGWRCVGASEIAPFPKAVVEYNHPEIPSLGDMTKHHEWNIEHPDLVCGGTPCQSFSVAGLRAGLADPRGNLALVFLGIVDQFRPTWVVWENVPGVYSATSHDAPDPRLPDLDGDQGPGDGETFVDTYDADEDHAFACFLAGLQELGYGVSYRTLDAQYFGVAQRRRRPFVVGYLGDWRPAAAVLLEPESMSGDPAPSRGKGQRAPTIPARSTAGGGLGTDFDCDGGLVTRPLTAGGARNWNGNGDLESSLIPLVSACETADTITVVANQTTGFVSDDIAHIIRREGFDASEDGTGRGTPLVPMVMATGQANSEIVSDGSPSLTCDHEVPIVFDAAQIESKTNRSNPKAGDPACTLHQHDVPIMIRMREGKEGGGKGPLVSEDQSLTLATSNDQIAFTLHGSPASEVASPTDLAQSMRARTPGTVENSSTTVVAQSMAVMENQRAEMRLSDQTDALSTGGGKPGQGYPAALVGMAVRRLTPVECERLQAFPDNYTAIPWGKKPASECPDGPRYKGLGNSWATVVPGWIGRRIGIVMEILDQLKRAA